MHLTVLAQNWNARAWYPWTLRGIYPYADTLIVNEACWVKGDWEGPTSPDGTAEIVRKFMAEEDPEGKVLYNQCGFVPNQAQARNQMLHLVPPQTDYLMFVESDEFYFPEDWEKIRATLERGKAGGYSVKGKFFYFDFHHYKVEDAVRIWKWFPGQHFYFIGHMHNPWGTMEEIPGVEMMHYSYVTSNWTRLKGCMDCDLPREQYESWWNRIYQQYDGENLEALYQSNGGGIHVLQGGPLTRYDGNHPPVLEDHPLRHWQWGEPEPVY